jgi:hypothetical protein
MIDRRTVSPIAAAVSLGFGFELVASLLAAGGVAIVRGKEED